MKEVFRTGSGRLWVVSSVLLGVVSTAGAELGCSSKSTDFDDIDRGGEAGTSGTDSGGGGNETGGRNTGGGNTGGNSGSAPGGTAGTSPSGGRGPGGRGGTNQGGAGAEDSGGEGASNTGGNGGTAGVGGDLGGSGGSAGNGMGGRAGNGGTAGAAGTAGSNAGMGGACTIVTGETKKHGQRGRSAGFTGTDDQYSELYNIPCASQDDCTVACSARGGSEAMCAATTCSDSDIDHCLPSTVWRRFNVLRTEGTFPEDGAELVLVHNPYEDFLLVDDFKLEVPATAEILGITVTIRRSALIAGEAADAAVRVIKGGVVGASDRSRTQPWTGPDYVNVDYGGPTDLWGQTWTPADVNAQNFGVALSTLYTLTGGNSRAYVDIVYATIHYRTSCR